MKEVKVVLSDEYANKTKEEKSALLDREVESFSEYMSSISNEWFRGKLITQEKVLIKSYLVWKIARDAT